MVSTRLAAEEPLPARLINATPGRVMAAYSEARGDFCPAPNAPSTAARGSAASHRLHASSLDRVDELATRAMQADEAEHAATSFVALCHTDTAHGTERHSGMR